MFEKTGGTKGILNPWRGASSFTHPQGAHMISHHVALETRHIRTGHKSLMAKIWAQTELPYKPNRHCLFSQETNRFNKSLQNIRHTELATIPAKRWFQPNPQEPGNSIVKAPVQNKHLNLKRVELNTKTRPLQASQLWGFAGPTECFCTADATMFSPKWLLLYACVKHIRQCQ